jgi:uncharacterized membrane protein YphA (DoxX/SURF4 family)
LRLLGGVSMAARQRFLEAPVVVRWFGLLLLVSAYLQGGFAKAFDFAAAIGEMHHFGIEPAAPAAVATIALELGASLMVLTGRLRWLGAAFLALFTLAASLVANRFWSAAPADRFALENAFFEHLGLVGGFLVVACADWRTAKSTAALPARRQRPFDTDR